MKTMETVLSSTEAVFRSPVRGINNSSDLEHFKKSETFAEISRFVKSCADAVVGKKVTDSYKTSPEILRVVAFLDRLYDIIAEIPPLKQPMRFGNRAFKQFHSRLCEESLAFLTDFLPVELKGANVEVSSYLNTAFGNETRIDYGTGHELSFVIFLFCINKLDIFKADDLAAVVLQCFTKYLRVMRKLHEEYLLEPAGSHGVWGLDDYHCLVFVWGAAQLVNHPTILPKSIHESLVLEEGAGEYIYLGGIQFIKKIKKGAPFSETSPMLSDISIMGDWARVCTGLMRMFEGEVLSKLPVVQHLLFGSILQCSWYSSPAERKNMQSNETITDNSLLSSSAHMLDNLDNSD